MTKPRPPAVGKPAHAGASVPAPGRKARSLPPLAYLDVRAVAEACVMKLILLSGQGDPPKAQTTLSVPLAFEWFRAFARGEVSPPPAYEKGFGDARDDRELGERFGICLAELVAGGLLIHRGSDDLYKVHDDGAVTFHGAVSLTAALMDQVDLAEDITA